MNNPIGKCLQNVYLKNKAPKGASDNEYVDKDGCIRCRKCNEEKRMEVDWFDSKEIVKKIIVKPCSCIIKKREEQQKQFKWNQLSQVRDRVFNGAFSRYKKCNVNTDDKSNEYLSKCVKKYIDNFDTFYNRGKGLLFYGGKKKKKTFAASSIINGVIEKENVKWQRPYKCCITNFAMISDQHLNSNLKVDKVYEQLNANDLLVIDDWGTERNTPFMKEIITKVINNRYNSNKPLIITTNLDAENILKNLQEKKELDRKNIRKMTEEEIYLSRLYSRFSEMCVFIRVKGKDRRDRGII